MSERASQMCAVIGTIDPQLATSKAFTSDVMDASLYDSILFIVQTGTVSSCSGKLKLQVYEGTATATVTTSVGATTWTATATGDNNIQFLYDLDCADLSGPNYRYVKGKLTVSGNSGAYISMVALGFKPRFHPASDGDLASVQVIKVST